jgi:hypothetical protein
LEKRWRDKQFQFIHQVIDGGEAMELKFEYYDLIKQLIQIGDLLI